MSIEVKWAGFDFGQCLMDPSGLRNYLIIGDVCKEVGEPERIDERIRRYRVLKEKYGGYGATKEGHRDEILKYVFENNAEAMGIFGVKEQEYLRVPEGTEEVLQYFRNQGIERAVVAELKKTLGPIGTDNVTRFLEKNNLLNYFDQVITPQGCVELRDGSVDLRYKGKTKEAGTLYDELAKDLSKRGINPTDAVMIGDKLSTDITPAKKRGFYTIQYIGYIDYGRSKDADFVISGFLELKDIVRGIKQ